MKGRREFVTAQHAQLLKLLKLLKQDNMHLLLTVLETEKHGLKVQYATFLQACKQTETQLWYRNSLQELTWLLDAL